MDDRFRHVGRTMPGVPFRHGTIGPSRRVSASAVSPCCRQVRRRGMGVMQGDQGRHRSISLPISSGEHDGRPSALLNRLMARFRGQSRTARDENVRWGKSTGLSWTFWISAILFDKCQTERLGMPVIPITAVNSVIRRLERRAPAGVFVWVPVDRQTRRDIEVCECGRARTPGRCCWRVVPGPYHG